MKVLAIFALVLCGCSGSSGDVVILLEAEASITDGVEPGDPEEGMVDGWSARYTKLVVVVSDVIVGRTTDGSEERDAAMRAIDLTTLPSRGFMLTRFEGLDPGRWDILRYTTPLATIDAIAAEDVSTDDLAAIENATFLVELELTKRDGESCRPGMACRDAPRIEVAFAVPAATTYGPCEPEEGLAGFAVQDGGETAASITFHGDHLFFSAFPGGAEIVERRAQYLADADANADDRVTREELEALPASMVFGSEHYALGGAPYPIATAWDFVRAQLSTIGHFQGEGECPWMVLR